MSYFITSSFFYKGNTYKIMRQKCLRQIFREYIVGWLSPVCSHFILNELLHDLVYWNTLIHTKIFNKSKVISYMPVY